MNVHDWKIIQDVELRKDGVRIVKEAIPKLLGFAQDLSAATDRAYDRAMADKQAQTTEASGTVVPSEPQRNHYCVACEIALYVPLGTEKGESLSDVRPITKSTSRASSSAGITRS
jgi:hypothetical protein